MGLFKQSKTLNKDQISLIKTFLSKKRNGLRNVTIFLLSVKCGLRAKEIIRLQWNMILDSDGNMSDFIQLPNSAAKGKSGRIIPLNKEVKETLISLFDASKNLYAFNTKTSFVVRTERSPFTTSQSIVNMFSSWYKKLGLIGCSSHSGRRTFITETAKKISLVNGSLKDIQMMVGHSSLQTTQRYIESDSEAQRKVVNLI